MPGNAFHPVTIILCGSERDKELPHGRIERRDGSLWIGVLMTSPALDSLSSHVTWCYNPGRLKKTEMLIKDIRE